MEKVISNTSRGLILESELTMIGVTREKAGDLVCNASNSVGYNIEKTIILVHCKWLFLCFAKYSLVGFSSRGAVKMLKI